MFSQTLQERDLRDVARVLGVAEHPAQERDDARRAPLDERRERLEVARLRPERERALDRADARARHLAKATPSPAASRGDAIEGRAEAETRRIASASVTFAGSSSSIRKKPSRPSAV